MIDETRGDRSKAQSILGSNSEDRKACILLMCKSQVYRGATFSKMHVSRSQLWTPALAWDVVF